MAYDFNPDKPIHEEALVLKALEIAPDDRMMVRGLRDLAWRGGALRIRYENSCSYIWGTTDYYAGTTAMIEANTRNLARVMGLHLYLQTDPRGATVYVSRGPIPDNRYNTAAQCIYYKED